MVLPFEGLKQSAERSFQIASQVLIPNEKPYIVCQVSKGFLIVTDRRVISLCEDKILGYRIEKSAQFTNVRDYDSLVRLFDVKEHQRIPGESKEDVRDYFQSTLHRCVEVIHDLSDSQRKGNGLPSRSVSYLDDLPSSLTRDALLDLNTILDDQPLDDKLVPRAMDFLGFQAVLIEETLREAGNIENGILFAAGQKGYYWVRGQKQGRFLSNVIVDTVEWNNVHAIGQRWRNEQPIIMVTYSQVSGGNPITMEYQWAPPINEETLQVPWSVEPSNGAYIFEDVVFKCTGRKMKLSINSSF